MAAGPSTMTPVASTSPATARSHAGVDYNLTGGANLSFGAGWTPPPAISTSTVRASIRAISPATCRRAFSSTCRTRTCALPRASPTPARSRSTEPTGTRSKRGPKRRTAVAGTTETLTNTGTSRVHRNCSSHHPYFRRSGQPGDDRRPPVRTRSPRERDGGAVAEADQRGPGHLHRHSRQPVLARARASHVLRERWNRSAQRHPRAGRHRLHADGVERPPSRPRATRSGSRPAG